MKKLLTAILLLCMSSTLFAQGKKSLVTPQMAKKTAYLVSNNMGLVRGIFQDANKLNSILKTDEILADIDKHLDCVENFCFALIDRYGTGDRGYIAFKDCGFTMQEFKIAEQIYENKLKEEKKKQEENVKKAEEARQKEIEKEQAIYDQWIKEGIPSDITQKVGYIGSEFRMDSYELANYIDFELGFRTPFIDNEYTVETDKDGVITISPTDKIIENAKIRLHSASGYEFTNLGKKLIIPSKNTIRIVEERQLAFSDKQIKIEWNKNENGWVLSNPSEFEKEIGSVIYHSIKKSMMIAITNTPSIDEHKKKKYTLSITAYNNGYVTTYIDGKKLTRKGLENYYDIKILK